MELKFKNSAVNISNIFFNHPHAHTTTPIQQLTISIIIIIIQVAVLLYLITNNLIIIFIFFLVNRKSEPVVHQNNKLNKNKKLQEYLFSYFFMGNKKPYSNMKKVQK